MIVKFTKDTYHPRKRSLEPDYKAGFEYNLTDEDAQYYIKQGVAVSKDLALKILRERANELTPTTNPFVNKIPVKKPSNSIVELLNALKITPNPNPQRKITLKIQDPNVLRRLKNKELIKEAREYFKDKDIPVEKVANLLIDLMDYAIDIGDDLLIAKLSADIQTLLRLTQFYNKE